MRLGLWSRLAIVATGLAVLIAPVWIMSDMARKSAEVMLAHSKNCHERANEKLTVDIKSGKPTTFRADATACYKDYDHYLTYTANWKDRRELAGGTLIICALLYALTWLRCS